MSGRTTSHPDHVGSTFVSGRGSGDGDGGSRDRDGGTSGFESGVRVVEGWTLGLEGGVRKVGTSGALRKVILAPARDTRVVHAPRVVDIEATIERPPQPGGI